MSREHYNVALCWYVVKTKTFCEQRAARELENQGFNAFLPLMVTTITRRGTTMDVKRPLFATYLFLRFDPAKPWYSIMSTHGVLRIVGATSMGLPVPIGNRVMVELRKRMKNKHGKIVPLNLARPKFIPEETMLRILTGPWKDFVGKTTAGTASTRVEMLLHLFGRPTKVTMSKDNVEVVIPA